MTTEFKGTSGPWTFNESEPPTIDGDSDGGVLVCEMPMWQPCFKAERDANARLMSAAPDLLASLIELLAPLECASAAMVAEGRALDQNGEAAFDRAHAAIAKALGA